MAKTKWVDCRPDMVTPIHARHVMVFLDGKDVTKDCLSARLPITPNLQVDSEVRLALLNEDGKHYLIDGGDGKQIAHDIFKGIVWWKYREDRQHLVKGQ